MKTNLTYYGHATFMLTHEDISLVVDPFFTGNTWEKAKPEDIKCQYIAISHAHGDHYGDADAIAAANNALIISTAEVAHQAEERGAKTHAMHLGGKFDFEFGSIRLVPAFHGAGIAGGHAAGLLITFYGKTIYYAGDTAYFSDMQYLNRFGEIDYALLPIGDNFTMGIEDAALAASVIKAKVTIPIHYKTWPVIDKDPAEFATYAKNKFGVNTHIVNPGETIAL